MTLAAHYTNIIGKEEALDLMRYVDEINMTHGGAETKLYSNCRNTFQKDLHAE